MFYVNKNSLLIQSVYDIAATSILRKTLNYSTLKHPYFYFFWL